jgi:hypothetical protein
MLTGQQRRRHVRGRIHQAGRRRRVSGCGDLEVSIFLRLSGFLACAG